MELNEIDLYELLDRNKMDAEALKVHDVLNPKIWTAEKKIKPKVRKVLMNIVGAFIDSLKIQDDIDIEDITLTGSMANYNYHPQSDLDVHVHLKYTDVIEDKEIADQFFKSKKDLWNNKYSLKIMGYDVECYVQDIEENHASSGVYSLLRDEWVTEPEKQMVVIDKKAAFRKAEAIAKIIEKLEARESHSDKEIQKVNRLKEKIKNMREDGLSDEGEFSPENLAFKILRYSGHLERLDALKVKMLNNQLSL